MVLHWLRCGRVGRSRTYFQKGLPTRGGPFAFVSPAIPDASSAPDPPPVRRLRTTDHPRRVTCPRTSQAGQAMEATAGDRPDRVAVARAGHPGAAAVLRPAAVAARRRVAVAARRRVVAA